jgi:hypothetical protein
MCLSLIFQDTILFRTSVGDALRETNVQPNL